MADELAERVAKIEAEHYHLACDIRILQEKNDAASKELAEIKLQLSQNGLHLTHGFENIQRSISTLASGFQTAIDTLTKDRERNLQHYEKVVESVESRLGIHDHIITELNQFKWFRDMANKWRDKALAKIIFLMAAGAGTVVILSALGTALYRIVLKHYLVG